ncbi:MAG: S8 family serine peptidase [Bacteriovoracaceae bacterium]
MMTRKALLALVLPLSFSSAFARVQMIPEADQIIKEANTSTPKFVLKNAKGTAMEKLFETTPANWFNLSPSDGAEGVRTEEAYKEFGIPLADDIIVAVVDSGVDVNHEDLQGKIWVNEDEIADNGIDDDNNGYIDDVFGWSFIGGSKGMAKIVKDDTLANGYRLIKGDPQYQIAGDSLEVTRELVRMKKLKGEVEELGEQLTPTQADYLAKLQKEVGDNIQNARNVVNTYTQTLANYKKQEAILLAAGVTEITLENVRALQSDDPAVKAAQKEMISLLSRNLGLARINKVLKAYQDKLDFQYNENFNPRSIVGDNYLNPNERIYGNNDVFGADPFHGTHVSGSIAANRENSIGIKGVASRVKIMAVRVVPNGDERDKDVANGIRYAVDNGARIINMSFGKAYSPYKKVVDEAVRYAESKGVLLVHAAGNDSKNNDLVPSFPTKVSRADGSEASNWLEICATSYKKGATLAASFTNYGKKSVDFCAPGVDILSTTPDNTYQTASGTSMATPTTAGVAALVLSHNPGLNAQSLKELLHDTSRRYPGLNVTLPGSISTVPFTRLSLSGSIVDAFEAIKATK